MIAPEVAPHKGATGRAEATVSGVATSVELTVADNPDERRYEARLGSEVVGFITYHLRPGRITLIHTEVDPTAEGKGIGSRLVAGALEDIRHRGLVLEPLCPFVSAYLRRHPDYADLVAGP